MLSVVVVVVVVVVLVVVLVVVVLVVVFVVVVLVVVVVVVVVVVLVVVLCVVFGAIPRAEQVSSLFGNPEMESLSKETGIFCASYKNESEWIHP